MENFCFTIFVLHAFDIFNTLLINIRENSYLNYIQAYFPYFNSFHIICIINSIIK